MKSTFDIKAFRVVAQCPPSGMWIHVEALLVIVTYLYYYDTIILISSFCLYHAIPSVLLFP